MKPAQKKKIERRPAGKKHAKAAPQMANVAMPRPLVKVASKIRSKILNIKAVESIRPINSLAVKPKLVEPEFEIKKTKIRIIGIGGGGGNIVSEIAQKLKKSSFCIANTDYQALRNAPKNVTTFQFGEKVTHGLGTGMDPRVAEEAAAEDREKIKKLLEGQDLVVIVSSLGGGTGSGAAPVFAQISKSLGNLTYGIFTMPFVFEGAKKNEIARNSLEKLRPYLNAITILPNERVFEVVPKNTPFSKTLSFINTMLSGSLEGLIETIYDTGVINIDFADLRAILAGNGKMAFLNSVLFKKGEEANLDSFDKAFSSPLYPYTIDKARGLLLNIVAQNDLKLLEVNKILTGVASRIHKDARIIFGVGHEGAAPDSVRVTVLATGCIYDGIGDGSDKEIQKQQETPVKETVTAVIPKKNGRVEKKRPAIVPPVRPAAKKFAFKKNKKKSNNEAENKADDRGKVSVKIKKGPDLVASVQTPREPAFSGAPANPVVATASKDTYQNQQSIAAQFESPVRKNALQVKKEIEMEENEMLEKEKVWDVPAFLRKQKK
jgi:cell division protein FtsZ